MKKTFSLPFLLAALAFCSVLPGASQSAGYVTGNPQATVRGGASADVDIIEGGGSGTASGTVSVKMDTLSNARKYYAKFTLTGNPNTNGPLFLRYDTAANSGRQDVAIWSLDQEFPSFTSSTQTWNTAQANNTTNAAWMMTEGPATATYYRNVLSATGGNAVDYTHKVHGPWGHMIRPGNVIYLVLTSTNNVNANGLRFAVDSLQLGFDSITSGTPPSIGYITNFTVQQGEQSAAISFTVGDPEDGAAALFPFAESANENIAPTANILIQGTGTERTLQITGGPNVGTTEVTISITDSDGNIATRSFYVTVTPADKAPIITSAGFTNAIPWTNTLVNTAVTIPFAVSDAETANSGLTVSASIAPQSTGLLQDVVVNGAGPNTALSLTVTPTPGAEGVGAVRVQAADGINTTTVDFCVMVRPSAKVIFVDHFEYDGANSKLTDQAPGFWTRRNNAGVFFRSGTDAATGAKVAWIRPSAGAENVAAPLVGGPYTAESRAVLYTKFAASFADLGATAGANIITNDNPANGFFRLSDGPAAATDYVSHVAALTNNAANPDTQFRLSVANGAPGSTSIFPLDLVKPVNMAAQTGPVTIVTRYDVATAKATLWVNGATEAAQSITGNDSQDIATVGYVGLFQERGYGDVYVDDMTVTLAIKPLITAGTPTSQGDAAIEFNAGAGDTINDFEIESAAAAVGPFVTAAGTFTTLGNGNFRVTTAAPGNMGFFKIKRKPVTF